MKYIDLFEKSKQIARDNNLTQLEVYQSLCLKEY